MAQSQKERDLEILNFRIDDYNETIANFIKYGISDKKRAKLETLRDMSIAQRDIVMAKPDY